MVLGWALAVLNGRESRRSALSLVSLFAESVLGRIKIATNIFSYSRVHIRQRGNRLGGGLR